MDTVKRDYQLESETRLAVVMYGGISLAIYIHGVAQELYHMVRATARRKDDSTRYLHPEVHGTEKVYRELGKKLKTRFVVDILSGTSAGGLNAIFLAKALATDRSMEFVKDFWVEEGDISTLLNDSKSLDGTKGLRVQKPTPGLLNGQRFYYKILEALMKMETRDVDFESPYVTELDLNITATDIQGLNLPVFVTNANKVVEPRFKNVFQFFYRPKNGTSSDEPRNDFTKDMDPFLAFAGRCTASIPPAFEAIRLKDIETIMQTKDFKDYYGKVSANHPGWKSFYKDYLDKESDFTLRSFGDGGYLDNKPFSYATDALLRRRADLPVDRRLIYIEPAPEHPEDNEQPIEKPDMIQNIMAALITLPRQESIREDLEKIQRRNQVIHRVRQILSDVSYNVPPPKNTIWEKSEDWAKLYLMEDKVLKRYGKGYIAYHQLLVESVIENLATAYTRAIGWNEQGEEQVKLHNLLRAWVKVKYKTEKNTKKGMGITYSQNDLLYRLDLSYRMRRCHFLQGILNILIRNLEVYLAENGKPPIENEIPKVFDPVGIRLTDKDFDWSVTRDENFLHGLFSLLLDLKQKLNDTFNDMKFHALALRKFGLIDKNEEPAEPKNDFERLLQKHLTDYAVKLKSLEEQLKDQSSDVKEFAHNAKLIDLVEDISITLASHPGRGQQKGGYLSAVMEEARTQDMDNGIRASGKSTVQVVNRIEQLLQDGGYPAAGKPKVLNAYKSVYKNVLTCLAFYYQNYDFYDMLTFPITYGTDAGETDEVEVIRISPEDAKRLMKDGEGGKKKLAGTQFSNFGAFFKKEWRENDMLWGRLDTAEVLINELLKDDKEINKGKWMDESFKAILNEDLRPKLKGNLQNIIRNGADGMNKLIKSDSHLFKSLQENAFPQKEQMLEFFKKNIEVDSSFPPGTIQTASRALNVTANLFDDLFKRDSLVASIRRPLVFTSRFGAWLLLAAQGGSVTNLLALAFYLGSILLILAGSWVAGFGDAAAIGWLALIVTLLMHATALRTRAAFSEKLNWLERFAVWLVSVVLGILFTAVGLSVLLLIILGLVHLGMPLPDTLFGKWIGDLAAFLKESGLIGGLTPVQ